MWYQGMVLIKLSYSNVTLKVFNYFPTEFLRIKNKIVSPSMKIGSLL